MPLTSKYEKMKYSEIVSGVKRINKREAYKKLKAKGKRRTKSIKPMKRYYLFDGNILNINSWRNFDILVERALKTNRYIPLADWETKEILVFAGEKMTKKELKKSAIGKILTNLLGRAKEEGLL